MANKSNKGRAIYGGHFVCAVLAVLVTGVTGFPAGVLANPSGALVAGGDASFGGTGTVLEITQNTPKLIINWSNFDIQAGETTRFVQPSASAIALNRVMGSSDMSHIDGALTANGHVMIVNPNGVIFGSGASVNVGALVATTADIDDGDFLASSGVYQFNQAGALSGRVENNGHITVGEAGLASFVAPGVYNNGVIEGHISKIALGAGDTFGIDLYGDGLVNIALADTSAVRAVTSHNSGSIDNDGGTVLLTTAAAGALVTSAVNTTGSIRANSLITHAGRIRLAAAGGKIDASGTLDTTGEGAGQISLDAGKDIALTNALLVTTGGDIAVTSSAGKIALNGSTFVTKGGGAPGTLSMIGSAGSGSAFFLESSNHFYSGAGGDISVTARAKLEGTANCFKTGGSNVCAGYAEASPPLPPPPPPPEEDPPPPPEEPPAPPPPPPPPAEEDPPSPPDADPVLPPAEDHVERPVVPGIFETGVAGNIVTGLGGKPPQDLQDILAIEPAAGGGDAGVDCGNAFLNGAGCE